jgi:hypothetical protein
MPDPETARNQHLERHGVAGRAREADLARHGAATPVRGAEVSPTGTAAAAAHLREFSRLAGMPEER